jgi:hypothetical protein
MGMGRSLIGVLAGRSVFVVAFFVLGEGCGGGTFVTEGGDASAGDGAGSGSSSSGSGGSTSGANGTNGTSGGTTGGASSSGGTSSGGSTSGSTTGSSSGTSGGSTGSGTTGSSSGTSSGTTSSSSSGASSGGVDAGTNCAALGLKVNSLRPAARQCCATCNHLPCAYVVPDECCPLTVDNPTSQSVVAFEDALKAFNNAGCHVLCPAIACRSGGSGVCDTTTMLCAE